ncbi:hypothetical protein K8R78_08590 [bacterium]|nr:hypothetical protein [bacterium]
MAEKDHVFVEIELPSGGSLKVNGPRDFVEEQIAQFDKRVKRPTPATKAAPQSVKQPATGQKRRGRRKAPLPELNLAGGADKPSLKEFVKGRIARNNYQRCALYVHYLNKVAGYATVSQPMLKSCFKEMGFKAPANMSVSIHEGIKKYEFFTIPGRGLVALDAAGRKYVKTSAE